MSRAREMKEVSLERRQDRSGLIDHDLRVGDSSTLCKEVTGYFKQGLVCLT